MAVVAVSLGACRPKKVAERRCITVSILPEQYFLKKIVGDNFDVKCMLSKGGNPETYEPSMANMIVLEHSEAYFLMGGGLDLELSIKGKIKNFNSEIKVFDMSEGIDFISGSHYFNAKDAHGIDPHTWTSVKNARIIARNMFDAVCQLDKEHEEEYRQNYMAFDKELDSLQTALTQKLAAVKGSAFVVWHPSLGYFARDFGLVQLSMEVEGRESTVKDLEARLAHAAAMKPKVFFIQKNMDSNKAQAISKQLGTTVVQIDPLEYVWKREINKIADAISSAK